MSHTKGSTINALPTSSNIRPHAPTRRLTLVIGIAILALFTLAFQHHLFSDFGITMSEPTPTEDGYHGKTLTVSNYTVVQGLFKQSDPDFKDGGYDLLGDSFGLIDTSPDRWIKFEQHTSDLNKKAGDKVTYKVIYLARHGQGVHNVAEEKYGTPAWNCKWSLLETDGELVWGPDPLLTPYGRGQVVKTADAWKEQIKANVPLPQVLYSSPLRRAIDTVEITWNDISLHVGCDKRIKENLREMIGLHTCDKRSTRSLLEKQYPDYQLDPDFTEADQLWTPDYQEQPPQIALRARLFLNHLFATDPRTFISITGHGGIIGGLLKAVGHRAAVVETGAFIPIVIRATSDIDSGMEPIEGGQSGTAPSCAEGQTRAADAKSAATATEAVGGTSSLSVESKLIRDDTDD